MKTRRTVEILIICFFFLASSVVRPVLAQLGAGVGLGSIRVEQTLVPGGIYKLPDLPVVNTGLIPAAYQVSLGFKANQPQFRPQPSWFLFKPQTFYLGPGQSQNVRVSLRLPLTAPSGDYFAYLEASTQKKDGQVALGPAAAAKLYFRVGRASTVLGAVHQRISTFWRYYQPWTFIILISLDFLLILKLAASLITLKVSISPRKKANKPSQTRS